MRLYFKSWSYSLLSLFLVTQATYAMNPAIEQSLDEQALSLEQSAAVNDRSDPYTRGFVLCYGGSAAIVAGLTGLDCRSYVSGSTYKKWYRLKSFDAGTIGFVAQAGGFYYRGVDDQFHVTRSTDGYYCMKAGASWYAGIEGGYCNDNGYSKFGEKSLILLSVSAGFKGTLSGGMIWFEPVSEK